MKERKPEPLPRASKALVAAVMAVFGPATCDPGYAFGYLCGDVNGNAQVTASDALVTLKAAVGQASAIVCGPQGRTLATGQTRCFDTASAEIPCAGTGYDGDLRKGADRYFADNGNGTVTDRVTGLIWELLDDGGGIHDKDNVYAWIDMFEKVVDLNASAFTSQIDWRVPNQFELWSLVNFDRDHDAIFLPYFEHDCTEGCALPACSCAPPSGALWSSSTAEDVTTSAWIVAYRAGGAQRSMKNAMLNTRAVRGGYFLDDILNEPVLARSCADVNASDTVTALDALAILKKAVNQVVAMNCVMRSPVLTTEQVTCYDAMGTAVPCPLTGQDGEWQRGVPHSFHDGRDGTVTDTVTGLMWEVLSADGSTNDRGWQYTWAGSVMAKIQALNTEGFAGYADWRVPNIVELQTLVSLGDDDPALFEPFNSECVHGCSNFECSCRPGTGNTWSSTTSMIDHGSAWFADTDLGTTVGDVKSNITNVRAVRAGY